MCTCTYVLSRYSVNQFGNDHFHSHVRLHAVILDCDITNKFREGKLHCVCYASVAACNVCVDACACTCGCKCKCDNVHSCMDTCTCVCSSAHSCGCVADGGDAMAAF